MESFGHECIGSCEIDNNARETYKKGFGHYPEYNDATKLDPKELPDFDCLCAGFPCQSFSVAGKRRGFADTRGTLFFEIIRIAREKQPSVLFLENVRGLLSHDKGHTFETVLSALDEVGYDAEWQVINGKYFLPQNRERAFIIGHLRKKYTSQIFPLEGEGGEDHSKDNEESGSRKGISPEICSCLDTKYGQRWNNETYLVYMSQVNMNMKQKIQKREITWTLTNNSNDFGVLKNNTIRKRSLSFYVRTLIG